MKPLLGLLVFLAALAIGAPARADTPTTGRIWTYGSVTTMFSPEWGLFAMPGFRYELTRSVGPEKRHYFDELFVGPLFIHKDGNLTFRLGLWYYFMGYPIRAKDDFEWSHNLELVPQLDYRWKSLSFTNRVIFHNTFYASVYKSSSDKIGWGTVLRELVQVTWWPHQRLGISAADEPFFGVIEDASAPSNLIGFWPHGLRLNRIYGGIHWRVTPSVSLIPQYVYETSYGTDGNLQEVGHYVFTTVAWVLNATER